MSYVPKDSKGRVIKPTQTLARKYNCAKGQIAMMRGCLKSIAFDNKPSMVSTTTIQNILILLRALEEDLNRDYILAKGRLKIQQSEDNKP